MQELVWRCLLLSDPRTVAASVYCLVMLVLLLGAAGRGTAGFCCCLGGCVSVISWYQQKGISEETRGDPQKLSVIALKRAGL